MPVRHQNDQKPLDQKEHDGRPDGALHVHTPAARARNGIRRRGQARGGRRCSRPNVRPGLANVKTQFRRIVKRAHQFSQSRNGQRPAIAAPRRIQLVSDQCRAHRNGRQDYIECHDPGPPERPKPESGQRIEQAQAVKRQLCFGRIRLVSQDSIEHNGRRKKAGPKDPNYHPRVPRDLDAQSNHRHTSKRPNHLCTSQGGRQGKCPSAGGWVHAKGGKRIHSPECRTRGKNNPCSPTPGAGRAERAGRPGRE